LIKRLYSCLNIIVIIVILVIAYKVFAVGPRADIYSSAQENNLNGKHIFYYFYGDYCGACKKIKPIIYQVADEFDYKYIFKPVNTEDPRNYELCRDFSFNFIPSVYLVDKANKRHKKLNYSFDVNYYKKELREF